MPYFFRKLGKMSQNLLSAAVMIGALRVKVLFKGYNQNLAQSTVAQLVERWTVYQRVASLSLTSQCVVSCRHFIHC